MPYEFLRDTHNIFRWLIILALVWTLVRVWSGLWTKAVWSKKDKIAGLVFTTLLNVQFLIGLILYFTSPIMQSYRSNFAAAMKDPTMRFFVVEHPFCMFLAVVIAQVGFSLSKRADGDRAKFLRASICYSIAGLLILLSIPWSFVKYGRPLFPGME